MNMNEWFLAHDKIIAVTLGSLGFVLVTNKLSLRILREELCCARIVSASMARWAKCL